MDVDGPFCHYREAATAVRCDTPLTGEHFLQVDEEFIMRNAQTSMLLRGYNRLKFLAKYHLDFALSLCQR